LNELGQKGVFVYCLILSLEVEHCLQGMQLRHLDSLKPPIWTSTLTVEIRQLGLENSKGIKQKKK